MANDPLTERLFQMKLKDVYEKYTWLSDEVSLIDFIDLFPVEYKNNKPLKPVMPGQIELTRDVFLDVLIAFRQSFN